MIADTGRHLSIIRGMQAYVDRFESRWTEVNGFRMHAKTACRPEFLVKPSVVLVHGLGVSHRYWAPTAMLLSGEYNVYMPDLPGFGQSEKPGRSLDIPELADSLGDWMLSNGLERAILMGNSMGCQVIAELAAQRPEVAEQVVFTGPSIDRRRRSMAGQIMNAARDVVHEPAALLAIILQDYLIAGPLRTLETLRFAVQDKPEDKLAWIQAPALVVRGAYDGFVSQEWAEELARRLPRGRLVVIPGAAHGVIFSAAHALVREINRFLY